MAETIQSVKIGGNEFKNIGGIVPAEKLGKKWEKIPEQPTPDADTIETLTMLNERLGLAKDAKQFMHDRWNQGYLQYRSINYYSLIYGGFPTYWNQWGMSVFIPRTFETVEAMKTQMMGRTPDFSVTPTRPSVANRVENMGYLTKSEYKRSKTQVEVAETVHDCLLYGAGIVRTDFVRKQEMQNSMSWNEDGTIKYTEEMVTAYSGVGSRRVDPYDFYPNPSNEAYRREKMGWAFERTVTDAWSLREEYRILNEEGAHGVTDNWKYVKPGGDTSDYKYLRTEINNLFMLRNDPRTPGTIDDIVGRSGLSTSSRQPTFSKDKIEVWEYWENDRYIVMTGTGLILRDSPNPYPHKKIPYNKYNLIEMNECWSMGMPEIMRWLQIEENLLHDQALNNIVMAVHKMFAVNSRYLEDESELVARPFGIIHLKQINGARVQDAVMPIEYNTGGMGNYFEFMRMNSQNIQTVTGVSPYMTGGITKDTKGTDTATQSNRITFAGQARVREISRHLEDNLIVGIVEDYIAIMQFYYQNSAMFPEGLPIEVNDPEKNYYMKFVSKKSEEMNDQDAESAIDEGYAGVISSDAIQGRYNVIVSGGSTLPKDPQDMADGKLKFFAWAQGAKDIKQSVDPATGQTVTTEVPLFNLKKIGKEVVKDAFDIVDADEYLYKEPEVAEDVISTEAPVVDASAPVI